MKIAAILFQYNKITEDCLKVRLSEEYDIFDKFFVVESKKTHNYTDKTLTYNPKVFEPWKDKIEYLVVPNEEFSDKKGELVPFVNEWKQRTWPIRLGLLEGYDFVCISDTDEIIANRHKDVFIEWLKKWKKEKSDIPYGSFGHDFRINFLDIKRKISRERKGMVNLLYKDVYINTPVHHYFYKEKLPNRIIDSSLEEIKLKNGESVKMGIGWHLSIIGNASALADKHTNCLHARQLSQHHKDKNYLKSQLLNTLKDPLVSFYPKDYPKYITDHWNEYSGYTFKHWIKANE